MSYLQNRWINANCDEGVHNFRVTCGVPQGSVLGPDLWNIAYNEVLEFELPEGSTLIGFADDLGLLTLAKTEAQLMSKTNEAVDTSMPVDGRGRAADSSRESGSKSLHGLEEMHEN